MAERMDSVTRSVVRDHDLAEMAATLEMPVGLLGLGEREGPVDNGMQAVHGDRAVHRLEIGAANRDHEVMNTAVVIGAFTAVLGSILVSLDTDELTRLLDLQSLADFLRYRIAGH